MGYRLFLNAKLELKLAGFVTTEKGLPNLHSKGIIAGINNVSKRNVGFENPRYIQPYLDQLGPVAYDKRIPVMVAGYFHDMELVIERLMHAMKDNGIFIMDMLLIGLMDDSLYIVLFLLIRGCAPSSDSAGKSAVWAAKNYSLGVSANPRSENPYTEKPDAGKPVVVTVPSFVSPSAATIFQSAVLSAPQHPLHRNARCC